MNGDPGRPSTSLVGRVLGGRYDVIRLLGQGGMGEVYEGNHRLLQKRVAIKVLGAGLAADDNQRRRFLREARAANLIDHENVVSILDFGDDDPTYFVMEFLEGDDLHALVDREGALRWSRARGIIQQVAGALGAAHARGIIHRDVKPSNCFVLRRQGKADFVKVLDFGIAKVAESSPETRGLTRTHELMGTVAYMAPEQALGDPVDARTDIYALGIVIYEMLSGKVPFSGTNSYKILDQHVRKPPPPPTFVDTAIPAGVEALIMRALAKDPADRFQSMDELIDAVNRIGTAPSAAAPLRASVPAGTELLDRGAGPPPEVPPTQILAAPGAANRPGPTEPFMVRGEGRAERSTSPPAVSRVPERERHSTSPHFEMTSGPGGMSTRMYDARQTRSRRLRQVLLGVGVLAAVAGGVVVGTQLTSNQAPVAAPAVAAKAPVVPSEPAPEPKEPVGPILEPVVEPKGDPQPPPAAVDPPKPAPPDEEPTIEPTPAPSDPPPPVHAEPEKPAPVHSKPSSGGKKAPKGYDAIIASLTKKARARCADDLKIAPAEVSFHVAPDGSPTLVKAVGASPAGACVAGLVRAAKFNASDVGRHTVVVKI